MSASLRLVFAALILATWASACDGPCRNLAEQICACEPNDTRERACLVNVDRATQNPINDEEERCEALLRTCTCDALDRGDFEACGLTLSGETP